jgi:hypothetical protein
MGFWGRVGERVRDLLRGDKEALAMQLAQSDSGSTGARSAYDFLASIGHDALSEHLRLDHDLLQRYVDYEEMDDGPPELTSALDIYADDATLVSWANGRSVWVDSPDQRLREILDVDLFQRQLRIEEENWEIARTLCKYGNCGEELLVTGDGVVGFNFLPPPTMRRIEGRRGELFGFIQDFKGGFQYTPADFERILKDRRENRSEADRAGMPVALEPWEVVHMRLRTKNRRSLYGSSVLESARWIWKRLLLLEDAALIFRLQRAPQRYAFYVDMGDTPPEDWPGRLNKIRQQYRKQKWVNPSTNKTDLRFNPVALDEDFFMPTTHGKKTSEVEVVGSPIYQSVEDLDYFREKLFAAIKIPKAYLNIGEGTNRAALSHTDARFARTILRIQRVLRDGYRKVCRVHLAAIGIDPEAEEFSVTMPIPSAIFELAQMEVMNARADLAERMRKHVSLYWVLAHVYKLSDDEIEQIVRERADESAAGEPSPDELDRDDGAARTGNEEPARRDDDEPREHRQRRGRALIGERELFEGSRDDERRAEDQLEKGIIDDPELARIIDSTAGTLDALRDALRVRKNHAPQAPDPFPPCCPPRRNP